MTATNLLPIKEALQLLGIRNFVLGIHDTAFPGLPEEEIGSGSPYSCGAARFVAFIQTLGFNGLQLGPQGITSPVNPSPYDGSLFSRNPLLLAPLPLEDTLDGIFAKHGILPGTTENVHVHRQAAARAIRRITADACRIFRRSASGELRSAYEFFCAENSDWLERDALYELLWRHHGEKSWNAWPDPLARRLYCRRAGLHRLTDPQRQALKEAHHAALSDFSIVQFLLAAQHRQLQERCSGFGIKLFGDLQVGLSERDAWYAQDFLLPGYLLGAPPSRTNPQGQSWNYPLFDPGCYARELPGGEGEPGPALRFFRARLNKLFRDFDGLRIDHPHGLLCPWVYRTEHAEPLTAVRSGARLFASPNLPDHPELSRYAIVRPDQIDPRKPRFDDNWVQHLDSGQVDRYATLFAEIMRAAAEPPDGPREIACEILSTCPYPVRRVMERYGLGRFRVTQKADLADPDDVYRSENAQPEDWVMLGSHDTPTIWQVAERWTTEGSSRRQAEYLAERLRIPESERETWIDRASSDPGLLVQAKFADLLAGPAANVFVYFTDLFGFKEAYNRPGTVADGNWSLRVPSDYRTAYQKKSARREALDISLGLALALRSKGPRFIRQHRNLIEQLASPEALADGAWAASPAARGNTPNTSCGRS